MGDVIETIPADDPERARQWVIDLRERVMFEAHQRGLFNDIPGFEEYKAWCTVRGFPELPITVEALTLYLLGLLDSDIPMHEIIPRAYSLDRIQGLTGHPPRHLSKLALASVNRAIMYAKTKLAVPGLNDLAAQAPRKALEMFPDGAIPMHWTDVA